MNLLPREKESLLLFQAGRLAQFRLARGRRLNLAEATALVASQVVEFIRDGKSVPELMEIGRKLLGYNQVLPGVSELLPMIQIEGTFRDGTKLVTLHSPIHQPDGDLSLALEGSFLPIPSTNEFLKDDVGQCLWMPGEVIVGKDDIVLNQGRKMITLTVRSTCDRPIQVASHYHFIETNPYLIFDRRRAYGMRLNIVAGTAVRFEPGEAKDVSLVAIGGSRVVRGGNNLCDGPVQEGEWERGLRERVIQGGFGHEPEAEERLAEPVVMPRSLYAEIYGPTTGDKVRLGDSSLVIEIEQDFAVYGDELKFGGGKTFREGMGQMALVTSRVALDTVITSAIILDPVLGILKGDVGIKDGYIVAIGKAGNPDTMEGVHPDLVCGVGTEAISGEGLILTPGGIDSHIHFTCPQLAEEAIASGITTMFGGGTGPATGTCATTCTPGPWHLRAMMEATDDFPINFGFTGKANTSRSGEDVGEELREQILAGAIGLKLHEDWGTTPSAIDHALRCADALDVQITIHTDTLNESGCVEHTIAAFKGRTIHTFHTEGAGGGHAPDIIKVVGQPNVLPSSTNPTMPFTVNTVSEHFDMLMVCHHLDPNLREDVAFAESRIRGETMAAEDVLHDMGAISVLSTDAHAMGRMGEMISRTWQTADKMKKQRGPLPDEQGENDNIRVRRYLAKYTINTALASGMGHLIGTIERGKLADLVLWKPGRFGTKPEIVIKGGQIAWAQLGCPNSSIPTAEPIAMRPMFGGTGKSPHRNSVMFVSKASLEAGIPQKYNLSKRLEPVYNCRGISKKDMILNDYLPDISVDPETYTVTIKQENGEVFNLVSPPASEVAMSRRYYLF